MHPGLCPRRRSQSPVQIQTSYVYLSHDINFFEPDATLNMLFLPNQTPNYLSRPIPSSYVQIKLRLSVKRRTDTMTVN